MAEQELWEMEGIVLEQSRDGRYRVRLENGQEITAEVAGDAEKRRFSISAGESRPGHRAARSDEGRFGFRHRGDHAPRTNPPRSGRVPDLDVGS